MIVYSVEQTPKNSEYYLKSHFLPLEIVGCSHEKEGNR